MVSHESLHAVLVDVPNGGRTRSVSVEGSWQVGEKSHLTEGLTGPENAQHEVFPVCPDVANSNRTGTHYLQSARSVASRLNQLAVSISDEHFGLLQRGLEVVSEPMENPRDSVFEGPGWHGIVAL
jgi:hypothetical protein